MLFFKLYLLDASRCLRTDLAKIVPAQFPATFHIVYDCVRHMFGNSII